MKPNAAIWGKLDAVEKRSLMRTGDLAGLKEELARTSAPIRDGTLILLDSDSTNAQVQNALVSLSLHNKTEENLVTPEHSTHVGGI